MERALRLRWPSTGASTWAIVDQMFVSGGNFATTLVLSRWLAPSEFGTFALINSVCIVVNGFHSNLVICPLMVFGGSETSQERRTYPTAAVALTSLLFPFWLIVLLAAAIYLRRETTGVLAMLSVFAWQFQETTRRALFAIHRHRAAIWGDLISYPGQALLIIFMMLKMHATLNGAFVAMAITSTGAALLQGWQAGMIAVNWQECVRVGWEFWKISKWLILSSAAGIAASPLLPWLLNWTHGRTAAAEFQAVMSVLNLTNPVVLSIAAIVIPAVAASVSAVESSPSALRIALRYVVQFELVIAPFLLALLVWPRQILTTFYGSASPYCGQFVTLRIGALACALIVPLSVIQCVFAGRSKTRNNAILQIGTVPVLLGAPLIVSIAGVPGAMVAESIHRGIKASLGLWLLARREATEVVGAST